MDIWLRFTLAVLATWRITHLLAREDGPAELFVRFRARVGHGFWGTLLDCFYCLSLWVALPLAAFVSLHALSFLVSWVALSGAACLLERMSQDPVVIHPLPEPNLLETNHALLRSETHDDGDHPAHRNTGSSTPHTG